MNFCNFISNHHKKKEITPLFRITIVEFEDRCNLNCGSKLAELLKRNPLFEVSYFNEPFSKSFLNLQGRNFFDFYDKGNKILSKTKADILIWGYEEDGKIRLNFQTNEQYSIPNQLSLSILDSLFVPLSYLTDINNFAQSLLLLINGIIIAVINPTTEVQSKAKPEILQNIIDLLSKNGAPQDLSREFMPYIMNFLGKIYLYNSAENLTPKDIKIIADLFDSAISNKQYMRLPIYYGCVYQNFAQLYETAFSHDEQNTKEHLKMAIGCYKNALKSLNRNFPYDYGMISYHLALMYFEFWKFTSDLQALRDAVSQLREAEKIYSLVQFPQAWNHIEELLGNYLTTLGLHTQNNEIMQLAINSYKSLQELYTQIDYPTEWAQIQEKIGNIFYLLGKQNEDENLMYEAKNYFNSALEIYRTLKLPADIKNCEQFLKKINNYID